MCRAVCLAAANEPEREVVGALPKRARDAALLGRGELIVADKGFASGEVESTNDTLEGELSLERHGGHTLAGVWVRVCLRVLTLAAGIWHDWQIGQPGRSLVAYHHSNGISQPCD